ncbi:hypothetical protein, partial [Bacillus pumilus]|uniref:hypothetical protein n=1 Tax=Bacillus pumilus TaxID=1408 RepID=UPI001C92E76D
SLSFPPFKTKPSTILQIPTTSYPPLLSLTFQPYFTYPTSTKKPFQKLNQPRFSHLFNTSNPTPSAASSKPNSINL